MKENLKYIAKLSTIALFSFVKINMLAAFSTIIVGVIGFFLLTKNIDAGNSGHASATPFLVMTFFARLIGSILWCLVCFGSPFIFFVLGNKYILSKLANKLITDKSDSLINPLLENVLEKFKENQSESLKNTGDFSLNKLKLIHEIQNNKSENRLLRKIIVFGMKKIKLDDINFSQENLNFFDIIKLKTIQSLQNITQPSRTIILFPIIVQWIILIFLWMTEY